jgi:hypothetical protein
MKHLLSTFGILSIHIREPNNVVSSKIWLNFVVTDFKEGDRRKQTDEGDDGGGKNKREGEGVRSNDTKFTEIFLVSLETISKYKLKC